MPGHFDVLRDLDLIVARYIGHVTLREAEAQFRRYMAHPDSHPRMRRLFDLSRTTSFEVSVTEMMALHARHADIFTGADRDMFIVALAPTEVARDLAEFIVAPWRGVPGMVATVQPDRASTLDILGLAPHEGARLFDAGFDTRA